MEFKRKPTQAHFIRKFNEKYREDFNDKLFERSDLEMIESFKQIIMSCERDKYFTLKVLSIRVITNYEDIYNALWEYENNKIKDKNKKLKENVYDYIDIRDSDIMLMEVKYHIRHNGTEKRETKNGTIDVTNPEQILTVLIALPRFVRKYYFKLNGTKYLSTYQVVDGSTYNNSTSNNSKSDSITLKTMFQPVVVLRQFRDMVDLNTGEVIRNIVYTSIIFSNHLDCMYYLLANFGLLNAYVFLGIYCIHVDNKPNEDPNYYCFKKHNLYISYPRTMKDPMVQSLAVTIYDAINKDTTLDMLYNIRFWLINLGTCYKNSSIDKGLFVLDSIDGVYDLITKNNIRLPEHEKQTIYHILRWMMREFVRLRAKENTDITTKQIRITDYCAATYATRLAKGIRSLSDAGKKVTLKQIVQRISTYPMFVIQQIIKQSNLVSYQDMVNDNDATTALKFTYKGIQGLGENNTSVQNTYCFVDPSHIGIIDLDASPTSDPGMSGIICPMVEMDGKFFTKFEEPNTWYESWKPEQDQFRNRKPNVTSPLIFEKEPEIDFMALRNQIVEESLEITRSKCPLYHLWNPEIKYSRIDSQVKEEIEAEPTMNLFTIIKDEEVI